MEKVTKKEMAIVVEAALTRTKVEDVTKYSAGPDAYMARRVRAQTRRRFGDLEHAYRLALKVCETEGLLPEPVDEKVKEPHHILALRESVAWWNERVTSKIKEDVPFTERKNNETPAWFDYAVSVVRAYEAGAVSPERAQELNDLAAMRTEIDRLSCLLSEQTERAKTLASDANKTASALAAESRQHEETRQKLQEATVRASDSIKAYVVVNKAELRELLKKINGRGDSRTGSIALEISTSKEYKSLSGAYQAQIKGITSTR